MTEAQDQAFKRVMEIAREHFTASVFIAEGDYVDPDKSQEVLDQHSDIECAFHGGFAASIGLTQVGQLRIYKTHMDSGNA